MSDTKDPFDLASGVPKQPVAPVQGELVPKPKSSIGMNKMLFGLLALIVILVIVVFILALDKMDEKNAERAAPKPKDPESGAVVSGVPTDLIDPRKTGPIASAEKDKESAVPPAETGKPGDARPAKVPPVTGSAMTGGESSANESGLSYEQQQAQKKKMDRDQRLEKARKDGLDSKAFDAKSVGSTASSAGGDPMSAFDKMLALAKGGQAGTVNQQTGQAQPASDQDQKIQFLKDGGNFPIGYHKYSVTDPVSRYELKAGWKIPAILELGVNSDQPGLISARVRENVYASINEQCLLIPSTSTINGTYDSRVAIGQTRQLVVWNQLIFPDGRELNLAGMPTADVDGQAGLDADVDNHWLRLFGVTFGMSMVTAGVQLSVPQSSQSANSVPSNGQIVSTALAQQYGQLGAQMLGKYLQVQPTLRNYPGEKFNIIVPRNIVFKQPWKKCGV